MKLFVLVFIALLSVAKAQETTSNDIASSVSDAADTTAETTTITAEASTAPSATTTETTTEITTTTASSIETTTSQVSASSLPSISTTSSNCRDFTTLCSAYKQLCQVPERCKKPHGSWSKSAESGSGERRKKSNDRHVRSTESDSDSDDDEMACDWVRQQQDPNLSQVNVECVAYTASPLQFSVGGRVDNGPGRKRGGGGRPNRAPLDCRFREIIAKFFRLLCPLTCGACK